MKIVIAAIFVLLTLPAAAQSADTTGVMEAVHRLFAGMKAGDSAMVRSAFGKGASLMTISINKSGQPTLRHTALADFLGAVGTPHNEGWSEMIWATQVRVDGNLAQVWSNYAFYLGKKFSHCGTDAFHLFKGPAGKWHIVQLVDTRRADPCDVPASIGDQFR
jgi:hypothetical protein